MPLPILHADPSLTDHDLVRYFHKAQRHWSEHLGEATHLDIGTAIANPRLGQVHMANRVLDAALPEGISPAEAISAAEAHFGALGAPCWQWVMNPSAPESQTLGLQHHLLDRGYVARGFDVMHLKRMAHPSPPADDLTIIPARASFRHCRALAEEAAGRWNTPQLAEAHLMHLDDPHWDALIALRGPVAVARAGVLTVGEIGMVEDVFVSAPFRRQGCGRAIMDRVLDICARARLLHVLLGVEPDNAAAIALYQGLGFARVGQVVEYTAPAGGFHAGIG